jgi:hypothetical protein
MINTINGLSVETSSIIQSMDYQWKHDHYNQWITSENIINNTINGLSVETSSIQSMEASVASEKSNSSLSFSTLLSYRFSPWSSVSHLVTLDE